MYERNIFTKEIQIKIETIESNRRLVSLLWRNNYFVGIGLNIYIYFSSFFFFSTAIIRKTVSIFTSTL